MQLTNKKRQAVRKKKFPMWSGIHDHGNTPCGKQNKSQALDVASTENVTNATRVVEYWLD